MTFIQTAFTTFICFLFGVPILFWFLRMFGFYAIVEEGTCHVYVFFGKVIGVLSDPGLYFLWINLGPKAVIMRWFGRLYVLDLRLDQQYLRSQPVNSEEGAPMGIGVWYEMFISDPVAYLFKNTDPRGSLSANLSSTTIRNLSNRPLEQMLQDRHTMSLAVRQEVSPKSHEWGYKLGSVYIRKVHFRDGNMISQIEEKVVNRLRQVTSAIRQDGSNQVNIIKSTADKQVSHENARARSIRPQIVGKALEKISADPQVAKAMFEILETEKMSENQGRITIIPEQSPYLRELLATSDARESGPNTK